MTSLSTRPDPPRRDGVVTPFPFFFFVVGGAPVCAGGFM